MRKRKLVREKLKPGKADRFLAMSDYHGYKPLSERRHWRICDGCGKRFSERDMVWIDKQGMVLRQLSNETLAIPD